MAKNSKSDMELMVVNKLITKEQLGEAMDHQRKHGGSISAALIKKGFVNEEKYLAFQAKKYNLSTINLDNYEVDPKLLKLIPQNLARKYNVVPVSIVGNALVVAISDPSNQAMLDELKFVTKRTVKAVLAGEGAISKAIEKFYLVREKMDSVAKQIKVDVSGDIEMSSRKAFDVTKDDNVPIVKFINTMILQAVKAGASDIHVEVYRTSLRIRFRVDGVLVEKIRPDPKIKGQLISRLKIMAELDIAEKRLPQDGRFKIKLGDRGRNIDFRVSTSPCVFGEKVVLRLIDDTNLQVDMTNLGLEAKDLQIFRNAISQPKGLILITGPTGSGKTQSLYSAILELNQEGVNISTAEDPVEYNLEGINQVWVKEDIGLTFAECLKCFLRQDPDIVMIGEIRDKVTAEIAIKAALTGHLVFSTLHTNDAPSTINRILDMGIEAYNLMPALSMVVAQRLARKICPKCKQETKLPPAELINMGVPPEKVTGLKTYKGRGCSYCNKTGYKGRIGIFEVLPIVTDIKECVLKGASNDDIRKEGIRLGMNTLRMDAINKFVRGLIDIDEVVRITSGE